jgi:DNA-binding MarR family transcriptional regulator
VSDPAVPAAAGGNRPDAFDRVGARWDSDRLGDGTGFLALGALLRAHTVVTAAVDAVLRGRNLSRTGYLVLVGLYLADEGTRSHGRLARDLLVHPTTITLVTDQLVKEALVRRAPDPSDRRATLSTITAKGRRLVVQATRDLAAAGFGFGDAPDRLDAVLDVLRPFGDAAPVPVPRTRRSPRRSKTAEGE